MQLTNQIKYIVQHRHKYLELMKIFNGKARFRDYFHDLDKVILLLCGLNEKCVNKIHRKWSGHHPKDGKIKDVVGAVIDWESARFTKPDKPLNARQTYEKYYSNYKEVPPVLTRFKL